MKIFNFYNQNIQMTLENLFIKKPSTTDAEDFSLIEGTYNCRIYKQSNNLENNNCNNNHTKEEDWLTLFHQKHNNKHNADK